MQKIQELIATILLPEIIAQKSRLFLWSPVCFAIGIAIYFGLKSEPNLGVSLGALIIMLAASIAIWRRQRDASLEKSILLGLVALSIGMSGFVMAQLRSNLVYTPMIVKKISPVGVQGVIDNIEPMGEGKGSRIVLKALDIERLSDKQTPHKIRLTVRKDEGLKAGQRIKLLAGLNPASSPSSPGGFDFQRMAYFKGLGAVGFSYSQPEILEQSHAGGMGLKKIRETLSQTIGVKTHDPQQSIIIALMTGQRGAITDDDWRALRESGLAHLLAISGLHVGMVAGVIFFFSRLLMACSATLALHHPIKKYAAAIALVGALLYTLIVGATIPTQRALMMTGLVMLAIMVDRSPFSLRLVALAAFVVLFFSPESLTSVSFQMSFAAVVALISFYEWLRPQWVGLHRKTGITRRVVLYFVGISLTTLVAGFATGLFSLFHFQNYAVYGLLANMIAVPLMALIVMPLIVLTYVLMPLGLSSLTLPLIEWAVGWILATAHYVSGLEGAVWLTPSWPHWIFILMVLTLWTFIVWKGRLKLFLILVFVCLIALAMMYQQPNIQIMPKLDLVSVRDNQTGKLWFSTGRKERYTAKNWLRQNGQVETERHTWPKEGGSKDFPLQCDVYGCRGIIEGHKISISNTVKAAQEDCNWADIIVSKMPIKDWECQSSTVIDYFDLWRHGGHAIWLQPNKVIVRNVEEERGLRLWTQTSANSKSKKTN